MNLEHVRIDITIDISIFIRPMSYKNEDINCYINSYIDTSEKADRITSIRHIAGILKLRIRNSGYG